MNPGELLLPEGDVAPDTHHMEPMDQKWQCAMCVVKPSVWRSAKDAVTYVNGRAVCADHARELMRQDGSK